MNKSFDIIEKSRKARTIKILAIIIPTAIIGLLIYLNSQFGKSPYIIVLIVISFIILFLNPFLLSSSKKVGELLFKTDFLQIIDTKIYIKDIQSLYVVINNNFFDRQGSPSTGIGNTSTLHGTTNKIMVKTKNDNISHSFQVKYSKDIETIKKILEIYKIEGVKIIFYYRKQRLM